MHDPTAASQRKRFLVVQSFGCRSTFYIVTAMTNPEPKKTNLKSILIIIVTLVFLFIAVRYFSTEISQVKTLLHDAGPFAFIVAILIYGVLGATVVPSEPLTALLGGLYSPWQAMLVAMLGNTLAALIEYYLGGHIGNIANFEKQRARLPFGLGKFPVDSPVFLIFGRMIPAIGPKLISLMSGIYKVKIGRYIWTTIVTNLLGAALIAYGAAGLIRLFQ